MFCPSCGKEAQAGATFCSSCGKPLVLVTTGGQAAYPSPPAAYTQPQQQYPPPQNTYVKKKDEGIAAVLSFLFTGLGQIYNGEIGKGLAFIVIGFILAVSVLFLIGFLLYPVFWIYNIYDAYSTAKRINAGQVQV